MNVTFSNKLYFNKILKVTEDVSLKTKTTETCKEQSSKMISNSSPIAERFVGWIKGFKNTKVVKYQTWKFYLKLTVFFGLVLLHFGLLKF